MVDTMEQAAEAQQTFFRITATPPESLASRSRVASPSWLTGRHWRSRRAWSWRSRSVLTTRCGPLRRARSCSRSGGRRRSRNHVPEGASALRFLRSCLSERWLQTRRVTSDFRHSC